MNSGIANRFKPITVPAALIAVVLSAFACQKPAPAPEPVNDAVSASAPAAETRPAAMVDQKRLENAESEPGNWMTYNGDFAERRYSKLDGITTTNVDKLGLSWTYEFDTNRGQEATPLIVDGVMYVSSAWSKVFALDARTGKELWKYDPKVIGAKALHACCDVVNRGVALWKGRVYVGTIDGRLIALDARTGAPVWSVVTADPAQAYTITGAPRVFKDKVIIGNGGAELGVRGYVTAYDTETGKKIWRFYTVPGDPAKGADGEASDEALAKYTQKTWYGQWWKLGGGGTVWDAMVYDPELDQLYIGVGNGSPWNQRLRSEGKGDNLFLSSVVALNPDTGKYLWHYQGTPGESWDFTQSQQMTLATLQINGASHPVLMQAPKNGFFYVIDRKTGQLLSAKNFVPVNWASGIDMKTGRPIENPAARYAKEPFLASPSANGAHNWHPMSYSPLTGLVYLPTMQIPFTYGDQKQLDYKSGHWNLGVTMGETSKDLPKDPAEQQKALAAMTRGRLVAWDPVQQREVWHQDNPFAVNGGVLSTAGHLVFQGDGDGVFNAYDDASGKKLWSFAGNTGIVAGPSTYTVDGTQYVAVLAGYGGAQAMSAPAAGEPRIMPRGRVLVFALGGTATLPTSAPTPIPPLNPPDTVVAPADIAAGGAAYGRYCVMCHYAGYLTPNLQHSPLLYSQQAWAGVVIDGQREPLGMASFRDELSAQQADQVRLYLIFAAQQAKKAQDAAATVTR